MRKLLLLLSFFTVTPAFLIFSCLFLIFLTFEQSTHGQSIGSLFKPHDFVAYAALPDNTNVVEQNIESQDVRVGKVLNFLQSYNSPLSSYAQEIIDASDKYNIDYRWIPAIAMQESGGCQKLIGDSNNCWGYGIHGGRVKKFDDFSQGIDTVGAYLAKNKENGLDTIEKLGNIYNPSNYNDWKGKVSLFLSQM